MKFWKPPKWLIYSLVLPVIGCTAGLLIFLVQHSALLSGSALEPRITVVEAGETLQHPAVLVGRISAETGLGGIKDPELIRLLRVTVAAGADLRDLARFKNVEQIELSLEGPTDLGVLATFDKLDELAIHVSHPQRVSLSVLSLLQGLRKLTLRNVLTDDLDDLANLPDLRFITVLNGRVADLGGLTGNGKLQSLIIDNFPRSEGIAQDSDLFAGDALASYDLAGSPQLDLGQLGDKPELRILAIVASPVTGLAHLSQMSELHALWLLRAGLIEVPEIATLLHLRDLMLPYNDQIADVGPVSSLLDLEGLNLRGTRVADLGMIRMLPRLESLNLRDTPAATQSTPLLPEGLRVLR
jgi:hypothetical protein